MHGLILGVAVLAGSAGLVQPVEVPPETAVSLTLTPADFAWKDPTRTTVRQAVRSTSSKRFSTTEKVIAIAAGSALGFIAGGYVGAAITMDRDGPYDDGASAFKGFAIGAPIGAAVGAILGWRLTR